MVDKVEDARESTGILVKAICDVYGIEDERFQLHMSLLVEKAFMSGFHAALTKTASQMVHSIEGSKNAIAEIQKKIEREVLN